MKGGDPMQEIRWKGLLPLFFFLVVTYIFKQFQGGFVSNFLFYSVLAMVIFELLLLISSKSRIEIHRRVNKTQLTAGQKLYVEVDVSIKGFLPLLWISVEDVLPSPLQRYTTGNRYWGITALKRGIHFYYDIEDIPRGEHQFGEVRIHMGDFFGFFQRVYKETIPLTVMVFPAYQNLRSFKSINEKNTGMQYSLNRSAEDVTSVMGIRNYVSGDRLSRIHWKATARSGQLKTKEFEYHVTNDFLFFIDCEASKYVDKQHLYERSISLAATLIKYAIQNHFTAGLSAFREEEVIIPMARSQEHLIRLFKELTRLQPDSTYPLSKLLLRQISFIPYGTTAMILTSRIDAELSKAIAHMLMRKISIELFYVVNQLEGDNEQISMLTREGVSLHLIDRDDFAECLRGVGASGQVS